MTLLQVFVASPSDVIAERKILEEVVNEFNITWGDTQKVRLELLKWETHARPGFGEDAQDVINKQIGDEYDMFLGIMWGRFGSPTNRSESGTEEEFNKAYSRFKTAPNSLQIMLYFKDAGLSPGQIDPEQLGKVQKFRNKISSELGGLYHLFENTEEFRTKVRMHLSMLVQDWLKETPEAKTKKAVISSNYSEGINPLSNLAALTEDDYDEGLIELTERVNDVMACVADVIKKMGDATIDVGKKFKQRTDELNLLANSVSKPDIKAIKHISNNVANDLDVYTNRLAVEIPEFHKQHSLAMDMFGKIAMISNEDLKEDPKDLKEALIEIQKYKDITLTSSDSLLGFRETTANLPRMTTAFNRARRRATAVLDDLITQLRTSASQIGDVEQLIERMIETSKPEIE